MPDSGIVQITGDSLIFSPESESAIGFDFGEIVDITENGNRTKIILTGDKNNSFHRTLILHQTGLKQILNVRRSEGSSGFILTLFHAFAGWPLTLKTAIGILAFVMVILLFLEGISTVYLVVPTSVDNKLGSRIVPILKEHFEVCSDPKMTERIESLKRNLLPKNSKFDYQITIIKDDLINAFALPGGNLILFSGLLEQADSADEVAGVLAHEIAHVENRHGLQSAIKSLGVHFLITLLLGVGFEEMETIETLGELSSLLLYFKYSRSFETEADLKAIQYIHNAGLSVTGLIHFFSKVSQLQKGTGNLIKSLDSSSDTGEESNWFSSHPVPASRVNNLKLALSKEPSELGSSPLKDKGWKAIRNNCEAKEEPKKSKGVPFF